MLTEAQITTVWEHLIGAETRALYFADLATRSTTRKQWITGLSFFLSSGAAASIIGQAPSWVPVVLALIVAAASAYTMAGKLDSRIAALVKLHATWGTIATRYDHLWNHVYDEDAEAELAAIQDLEHTASAVAVDAHVPYDAARLDRWEAHVFAAHQLSTRSAS